MKLPCAVTRDLLPLYAENMVEQETKVLIEEHLNECDDCKKKLSEMNVPAENPRARPGDEVTGGCACFHPDARLLLLARWTDPGAAARHQSVVPFFFAVLKAIGSLQWRRASFSGCSFPETDPEFALP